MRALPSLAIVLALSLGTFSSVDARADPSPREELRSRQLFDKGHALADEGKWAEACPLFAEAHKLHATNGTAISLADCYEKSGEPDRAVPYYEFVIEHASADRVRDRVKLASERLALLRPKPKPVEPPPAPPPPPPPDEGAGRAPVFVAFGAAGAGAIVGVIFGALALSDASKAKAGCSGNVCPTKDQPFATSANTKAWVSNVGFAVAIAGVAAGVTLLLVHDTKPAAPIARVLAPLSREGLAF